MRFLKGGLFIAFLLGAYFSAYAQNAPGIHGKVYGENHLAAAAANIILLAAADSAIIKSVACDDAGQFSFATKPGRYLLLISRIGYDQSLTGPYEVKLGENLFVGNITLTPHIPLLKEVSISAQRSYVEAKADKVTLNVQNSIVAEGNSVFEILRQAPGVYAGTKGDLSLIGHANAMVMVDGKQVHLSGQDLMSYLQGLAGNSVKQIELITSPSAKYDAAGAGIINIITKKGTNIGTNFTLTGTGAYGKFGRGGGGLTFNSRQKKVNIFGNYNYQYRKTDHLFLTNRIVKYNGLMSDYDIDYYTTYQGSKQSYNMGADYAISDKHTVGILLSGTIDGYNYRKNNVLNITNSGVLDSIISTKSKLNRGLTNTSYDINYTGKLDTLGKVLSADFAFNDIDRHSSEYIDNYFYNSPHVVYRPSLKLQNLSPADTHIWSAKIDYVNPLSAGARLEAGFKYSWVQSDNQLIFGPMVNGVYQSSTNLSSKFLYKENINSGYVNYIGKINKINVTAGLRLEQTNTRGSGNSAIMSSEIKRNYLDWFPQVHLNYALNDKHSFDLSFNRGIQRPQYENINPFLNFTDLYDYKQGNPNLLPQYSSIIQLTHTFNKRYLTTLYSSITSNFYDFPSYIQNDSSKVSRTVTQNFGKYSIYGIRFSVPVYFTNWWDADFDLDASYERIKAYPKYGNLNKGTQAVKFFSRQRFTLPDNFTAEVSGKYEAPTFYGIYLFKADYYVSVDVSKQILNKNGTLTFSANDVFNTYRDRSTINYQNLNMTVYDKIETRLFKLTFTYRFGNVSLKSIIRHSAGNEEEQKRATSPGEVAGN